MIFRVNAATDLMKLGDTAATFAKSILPAVDNATTLGSSGARFSAIWAANGTIQTSDARDKDLVSRIGGRVAAGAVDAIEPAMFRWKKGSAEVREHFEHAVVPPGAGAEFDYAAARTRGTTEVVTKPGTRLHAGFIAQEIKAAMDVAKVDFGVWGLEDPADPGSRQWLRPDQLIPVLWAALRETRAELAALRAKVEGAG
jgi:hypothetical protein